MTTEQLEQLTESLKTVKSYINEMEIMISDYNSCQSDVSKKYLGAAIKKQVSELQTSFKIQLAE